jgi:hypothetical protein
MKFCLICKETKSLEEFYLSNRGKFGRSSYCKLCSNLKGKLVRQKNKEKTIEYEKSPQRKEQYLVRKYGITLDFYTNLLIEQKEVCCICQLANSKVQKALSVDHNHITKKVRGLLCDRCNKLIGFAKDLPKIICKAIAYLEGEGHPEIAKLNLGCLPRRNSLKTGKQVTHNIVINTKDPLYNRKRWLRYNWALTLEQYIHFLELQGNNCAICNTTNNNNNSLSIDHNHTTNKIRGLLCISCNRLLGYAEENISLLTKTINYLEEKN